MDGPLLVMWVTILIVLPLVLIWLTVVASRMWWAQRRQQRDQAQGFPVLPTRESDFP